MEPPVFCCSKLQLSLTSCKISLTFSLLASRALLSKVPFSTTFLLYSMASSWPRAILSCACAVASSALAVSEETSDSLAMVERASSRHTCACRNWHMLWVCWKRMFPI